MFHLGPNEYMRSFLMNVFILACTVLAFRWRPALWAATAHLFTLNIVTSFGYYFGLIWLGYLPENR